MITTDGKRFVYGVFGADGCECDALEAVFDDEQPAVEYTKKLIETYDERKYTFYGEPELLEVRAIELGKKINPLENNAVWKVEKRVDE